MSKYMRTIMLAYAAGAGGCSGGISGAPTSELIPDMRIIASGTQTLVFAQYGTVEVSHIRLADEDTVRVVTGAQDRVLGFSVDPVNGQFYSSTLSPVDEGQLITFSLVREEESPAPSSTVSMPGAANITDPANNSLYFTGSEVTVTWTPSGTSDDITIVLVPTDCNVGGSLMPALSYPIAGDPGTATLPIDRALLRPGFPSTGTCSIDLRLQRQQTGTVDPAFASGGIVFARRIGVRDILVTLPD